MNERVVSLASVRARRAQAASLYVRLTRLGEDLRAEQKSAAAEAVERARARLWQEARLRPPEIAAAKAAAS